MDTGDCDLAITGARDALDLGHHLSDWAAPTFSAGRRDDAVRAGLVTARLDAQGKCRAARQTWCDVGAARTIALTETLSRRHGAAARRNEPNFGNKLILAVVGYDLDAIGKTGHFIGASRGIAARHHNSRRWIFACDFSND